MNPIMQQMLIYSGFLLGGIFMMNFATAGLPLKVLNVRASMGKKVLVKVHALTGVYYRTGTFDGTDLIYRARNDKRSERRRIDVKNGLPLFRMFGVNCVEVDEEKNAFIAKDFSAVQGHDAIKTDHLIKRALYAPKIQDKKDLIIIVILVIVVLLLLYVAYQTNSTHKLLKEALQVTTATV